VNEASFTGQTQEQFFRQMAYTMHSQTAQRNETRGLTHNRTEGMMETHNKMQGGVMKQFFVSISFSMGYTGDDYIDGGNDNDKIVGQDGRDTLLGEVGNYCNNSTTFIFRVAASRVRMSRDGLPMPRSIWETYVRSTPASSASPSWEKPRSRRRRLTLADNRRRSSSKRLSSMPGSVPGPGYTVHGI